MPKEKTISGSFPGLPAESMKLLLFSKKLGEYDVDGVGRTVSQLGLDGVDLTVRPGGHVEPGDVLEKLPGAVKTLQAYGLEVPMISTGVATAGERHAREIFSTASTCGIGFLKLGYWPYHGFGNVLGQLREAKKKIRGIQKLAAEYSVVAGIHVHSGDYLSATGEMVSRLLEGMELEHVGAYIDPGHMVVEGGRSGWRLGMDLLRDVIKMVAVKDFGWERDREVPKRWLLRHMPLSEGMVPWPEVFAYLRSISFHGPISLHSEYEDLSTEEIVSQTSRDISYLRGVIDDLWHPT